MEAAQLRQRGAAAVASEAPRAAEARTAVMVGAWGNCAEMRAACGARSNVARGVWHPHSGIPNSRQLLYELPQPLSFPRWLNRS